MKAKELLFTLRTTIARFDAVNAALRYSLLEQFNQCRLPLTTWLKEFQETLLFICAYPSNTKEKELAQQQLKRIALMLELKDDEQKSQLCDTGLPHTSITTTFSVDLLKWLSLRLPGSISFDSIDEPEALPLFLRNTLPDMLKEILTEEGMNASKILKTLFGKKKNYLNGILTEASKLDHLPALRDQLFDAMQLNCTFRSDDRADSLSFNRIETEKIFYHHDLLKKIEHLQWLNKKLPAPRKLNAEQRGKIKRTIRMSLLLLGRETEPSTWMDEDSIRIFDLERGISVCIYGMTKDHRQPLESYFGFTAFKNGYPMSYGGAWLFGKRALFGMNIFEWFRGGESALVFAQLLRTYRQFFGIDYFEVEPYQYGKDNPEGIQSGAFWFYHRFGFRLLKKELHELSETEAGRIAKEKGYRTPAATLQKFTHSNIGLQLSAKEIPLAPSQIRSSIAGFVSEKYAGDHSKAEKEILRSFFSLTGLKAASREEKKVLLDFAWFVMTGKDQDHYSKKKRELKRLVQLKNTDEAAYQQVLVNVMK